MVVSVNPDKLADLAQNIKAWALDLGFSTCGISGTNLDKAETQLLSWLAVGFHGEMDYMARHGSKRPCKRSAPGVKIDLNSLLDVQGTRRDWTPTVGYISRYALGRDYHKLLRRRLERLARRITTAIGPFGYRAFCDSAPVLEKPLAQNAGLGWIGKHTNLIARDAGSWFFLGELYTDLPLPVDKPVEAHCGHCQACMDICPTHRLSSHLIGWMPGSVSPISPLS